MKKYFIVDEKGRFYKSKSKAIKEKGYKWTSQITHSTDLTRVQSTQLKKAFIKKGINVSVKTI
jgi:hypothetical protein